MSQNTINAPVEAIRHNNETRAAIPTQELAGTEQQPENPKAEYDTFRHEFNRGRDPELYWLNKYANDEGLQIDIRSLYVHEDINPEMLINNLYTLKERSKSQEQKSLFDNDLFNARTTIEQDYERIADYYQHSDKWKNRLIQGDSLLVMNSLLQRENMAGKVQCIYIDPPYGIRFGGNWQMMINQPKMSHESKDNELSTEPETIKAFRDTWELGIHSYLSYLRDRIVLSRELLTESGSIFVQISDDNVHLVRNILDEIFGSENFVDQIIYQKTTGAGSPNELLAPASVADYIIWYAKNKEQLKFRKLFIKKVFGAEGSSAYKKIELADGQRMSISDWEKKHSCSFNYETRPEGSRVYGLDNLTSQSGGDIGRFEIEFEGKKYAPKGGNIWKTNEIGIERLKKQRRIDVSSNGNIGYVRYFDDFEAMPLSNLWTDTVGQNQIGGEKIYVVQSAIKTIQRCILMTTDPGDLVLDPTCGSGTTAYVCEQWGRRWITIDTSRIALNVSKKRITTAVYPYYQIFDTQNKDIRMGFMYKTLQHLKLSNIANNEPAAEEVLYDQPLEDKKRMRVSGPFTVETLQNHNVLSPESLELHNTTADENREFQDRIFAHLQSSGIINGDKSQKARFHSIESVANPYLNARGWYTDNDGAERLAYFHIGPKFGTVSKQTVLKAKQEMLTKVAKEAASWLVILGFSFEDNIVTGDIDTQRFGVFNVSKVRMHDDLMQDGLLKKGNNNGTFVIIGEPDIALVEDVETQNVASLPQYRVEIRGLDIYDPITDVVKPRSVADIAYWEIDSDYNGAHFVTSSLHFCGGDKKEFASWRKGLDNISSQLTRRNAERTLSIEFNDEIWDTLYGFRSEPISYRQGRKICVRIVSQFGEEASKVLEME